MIDSHLEIADVILLLVSPDFLASRYCYDIEVRRAMELQQQGKARVIPVILRPCDWHSAPFAKLIALPRDGKPITKWPDRDEAFLDVVQQIRAALPQSRRSTAAAVPETQQSASMAAARSSNLLLKKQFTEADRDRFLDESFEFMAKFFETSLDELQKRK